MISQAYSNWPTFPVEDLDVDSPPELAALAASTAGDLFAVSPQSLGVDAWPGAGQQQYAHHRGQQQTGHRGRAGGIGSTVRSRQHRGHSRGAGAARAGQHSSTGHRHIQVAGTHRPP